MQPLFLPAPANLIRPFNPSHPLHPTRPFSRLPPTNSLNHHSALTALTSLTLTLSALPPTPPPSLSTPHSTTPSLTVSPQLPPTLPPSTLHAPIAVVGVAHDPIHQYAPPTPPSRLQPPKSQHQHLNEDARRELFLAARLVTPALLGFLVGIERRATPLNLGVRSITLITLTSALCTVITTSALGIGSGVIGWMAAAPFTLLISTGIITGIATWTAASIRKKPVDAARPMSMVVGLVVIMGAACGAGLSLLGAVAYLTAVAVMRGSEERVEGFVARELHVRGEGVEDDMGRMVLRIAERHGGGTRVVDVGARGSLESESRGVRTDGVATEERF